MTKSLSYDEAACKLLDVEVLPLANPRFPIHDGDVIHYPGSLTDADEHELQCQVCLLTDLSPNDWPSLDEKQRLVWMRLALDKKRDVEASNDGKQPAKVKATNSVEAILGEDSQGILDIAHSDKSTEDKMRAIILMKPLYANWKSSRWAALLGVTDAAIRKKEFWKVIQAKKKKPDGG